MNFKFTKPLLLLAFSGMMFSCGGEDLDDYGDPEFKSSNLTAEITTADLIGRWEIYSMIGDQEVNFNGDEVSSTDMLSETNCFDMMYYEFDANGNVNTGQAKLWFDNEGDFTCYEGKYDATYSVSGDTLIVDFLLNGSPLTEEKKISLTADETGEYLHVTLSDWEAATYVNDPGTTNASHLGLIEMIYKKK